MTPPLAKFFEYGCNESHQHTKQKFYQMLSLPFQPVIISLGRLFPRDARLPGRFDYSASLCVRGVCDASLKKNVLWLKHLGSVEPSSIITMCVSVLYMVVVVIINTSLHNMFFLFEIIWNQMLNRCECHIIQIIIIPE